MLVLALTLSLRLDSQTRPALAEFTGLRCACRTGLEGAWRLLSGGLLGWGGGKLCLVQVGLSTCLSD